MAKGQLRPIGLMKSETAHPNAYVFSSGEAVQPVLLTSSNHSLVVDAQLDHTAAYAAYQAFLRTKYGTIVDVLSAQRLDLLLQVKPENVDHTLTSQYDPIEG